MDNRSVKTPLPSVRAVWRHLLCTLLLIQVEFVGPQLFLSPIPSSNLIEVGRQV